MPFIYDYKCSKCDLALQGGWGYYFYVEYGRYVEYGKGNRMVCRHPSERGYVEDILGENASLQLIRERTGFNSFCICLDCLHQFEADLGEDGWSPFEREIANYKPRVKQEKDKRECLKCRSERVKTVGEMVDEACPKCKDGVIEEIWTGAVS